MTPSQPESAPATSFDNVVCAIDGSVESVEAAYQGCRIAPGAPVTLAYVLDPIDSSSRASDYPEWIHESRDAARVMLEETRDRLVNLGVSARIEMTVEEGDVVAALNYLVAANEGTSLLTIGSGEQKEMIVAPALPNPDENSVAHWIVRDAHCSVLVARCVSEPGAFPASLVVGIDGSEFSLFAYQVAREIAARSASTITTVTALGGKSADLRALEDATPHVAIDRIDPDSPVHALINALEGECLMVVGNRGLHGVRALGSVSAALASHSPSSVLVVRRP